MIKTKCPVLLDEKTKLKTKFEKAAKRLKAAQFRVQKAKHNLSVANAAYNQAWVNYDKASHNEGK